MSACLVLRLQGTGRRWSQGEDHWGVGMMGGDGSQGRLRWKRACEDGPGRMGV